ncbi:MAG TPA: c-type cytochrome [Candidatus Baltobacteraceae bacterium]|jgi:ubiquinol-cytochrome c reductase cytochrome c subunit|nr:c-type cytochrome [Candidatus Baltobacteraceae bacterium]
MNRRFAFGLLSGLLAAVSVVAAPAATAQQNQGKLLFENRCTSCHGLYLQGSPDGPPLIGKSAAAVDFMLRTGRMPAAVAWEQTIAQKPQFDDERIRAIVAYVVFAGHGNPALPNPLPGNVAGGRALFAENCQSCHGITGHGASVGYAQVAPSLMSAAPEQIAEAVRIGPGVMPTFGTDVIAPSELDDIVSYVGMLQNRSRANNPGGLQLANIGPVAEGFVAWFFGIGLLVLLCRRIGTTD